MHELWLDNDAPREECGVFGIYGPDLDVARLAYFGLHALQHRGQESAGIAVAGPSGMRLRKRLGLVQTVFDESDLRHLVGSMAVGHTRYSTTGSTLPENAGPMAAESRFGTLVVAHNGNIVNAVQLREELEARGVRFATTTDSEVLTQLVAQAKGDSLVETIQSALQRCVGAFSLCILTESAVIGVRDRLGIRPLCYGEMDGGKVIASESCALSTVGAELRREVEPGEILVLDEAGCTSYWLSGDRGQASCIFEYIYFARPDSALRGRRIYLARQRMGEELAKEAPVDADVVIPLPDSAIPAAIGFARQTGIPYSEGLIKNRYIGRTFIQPDQRLREIGVQLKFNALPEIVGGKRVVIVDDSIVRGTTSRPIVDLLRSAGAVEVHMRVHSPPIQHPCYLGVDMATHEELIAANKTVLEIEKEIGADSLAYLSLEGLVRATELPGPSFCTACLTGHYPVRIDTAAGKFGFESSNGTGGLNGIPRSSEESNGLAPDESSALQSPGESGALVGTGSGRSRTGALK
jgi:amidophosphoribosyltransferase